VGIWLILKLQELGVVFQTGLRNNEVSFKGFTFSYRVKVFVISALPYGMNLVQKCVFEIDSGMYEVKICSLSHGLQLFSFLLLCVSAVFTFRHGEVKRVFFLIN